jgi:hypothetical protein
VQELKQGRHFIGLTNYVAYFNLELWVFGHNFNCLAVNLALICSQEVIIDIGALQGLKFIGVCKNGVWPEVE